MNNARLIETITENSKQELIETLLNDMSYHIEFNGHLTNHNKHAVVALSRLGASNNRIKEYYEAYARCTPYGYGLEAPRVSKYVINQDNWKTYLGKRTSYSSYYQFFDEQEKKLGMNKLLKQYMPILLPGWVGSLTHATIHLGWALDIKNRCMAIEGLAYMAFSFVSCKVERSAPATHANAHKESVFDSLNRIAHIWEKDPEAFHCWVEGLIAEKNSIEAKSIHPELSRSGLQYRNAKMLSNGHPLIYSTPVWIDQQELEVVWEQLYYITTLLYMVNPGDFCILHLITSLHAMEQIARYLNVEQKREVVKCFWIGMLCILFARAEFPSSAVLEQLNSTYKYDIDANGVSKIGEDWDSIIARAICEEEEHNPKMVYVLKLIWERSGYRSIYRIAASHFTTTPELPKSFEQPPTE